jgi:surfeit locus 1 family protein
MRRLILPLLFGLCGAAVLVALGLWQLQRLAWKEGVLAAIEARIGAPPAPLPPQPDAATDAYRAVALSGRFAGRALDVLASVRRRGPGYRVVAAFETDDGRRILVDRGFVPEASRGAGHAADGPVAFAGNLHWPDETDRFTPAPDTARALWFARDVAAMAAALGTEPVLVVARDDTGGGVAPLPVDTAHIPNDHLGYAIQWFALAAVWTGMTLLYLWRIRRGTT